MDIITAINGLLVGKSITRASYSDIKFKLSNDVKKMTMIEHGNQKLVSHLSFNTEDFNAKDWIIID